MLKRFLPAVLLFAALAQAQEPYVVEWEPAFPTDSDSIVVTFYADRGNKGLMGHTGDVYAHTGVLTDQSTGWRYVIADWNVNTEKACLTRVATDVYRFIINSPRSFYGVPSNETITALAFVFRDASSNPETAGRDTDGGDIFVSIDSQPVNVRFTAPVQDPVFASPGDSVTVSAVAGSLDSGIAALRLYANDTLLVNVTADSINAVYIPAWEGRHILAAVAWDSLGNSDSVTTALMVNPPVTLAPRPAGIEGGITYHADPTTATLSLFAPHKDFVYVIGDFNDWQPDLTYFMQKDSARADSVHWWFTLTGLSPGTEYAFQYLVDGNLRIADPYTEKVLDPWNDHYISSTTYPGLMPYPAGKTRELVSVLQTGQSPYAWNHVEDYQRPPKEELVIYELLLRDFVPAHNYRTLTDTLDYLANLGVNAIELLPVYEFEGNSSWGYNASFHFAPDKYYGPADDLKAFIDSCHSRGMAVIIDMVLNHLFGQSPLVRLYWDAQNGRPAADSPWFNTQHNFANTTAHWGSDLNHESEHTQYYIDRVNRFWLEEYHADGFRFDFTKGFSNTPHSTSDPWGSLYDANRIRLLKRMADRLRETDSTAYVILEHFAANAEEIELADYGMLLWGNVKNYWGDAYSEATMGWHESGKSDFSWGYYGTRRWTKPHLVTYMESHDEERLMYKNLQWGNSSGGYSVKDLTTALNRIKLVAAFFLTLPGPKMIWQFGELGYDISIDNPCRVCEKPIRWDYWQQEERYKLYRTYAALLRLRKENEIFRSSQTQVDFWLGSTTGLKRITLSHHSMEATIIGNFGVIDQNIDPAFQHIGTWYDFFSGDSITVQDARAAISLAPGEFHIFIDHWVTPPDTGLLTTDDSPLAAIPQAFKLSQNYPNPFNPVTTIRFDLPEASKVILGIYDLLGHEVVRLVDDALEPGYHAVIWNGKTTDGRDVPSGIYIARIVTSKYVNSIKMLLLK